MKKIISEVSSKKQQYGAIIATVHDKYGNLKQKVEQPVDSFNRQMWRVFFAWATARQNSLAPGFGITRLSNTTGSGIGFGSKRVDDLPQGYAGICIGSGTTPTTYDTVIMENLITYSDTFYAGEHTIEYDNTLRTATITRSFINLANDTKNINEVGVAVATSTPATTSDAYLYVRDILQTQIDVSLEDTLTVQYKLTISSGNYNYSNAFIQSQFGSNRGNTAILMTNVTGTLQDVIFSWYDLVLTPEPSGGFITNTGNVRQSLVFGTTNTAFNVSQIKLESPIGHGNGSGQLFYHPSNFTNMVENSSTNSMNFKITRAVENRSGSNIDIREVGMYKDVFGQAFMMDRKAIDPAVTITNGNIVTFQWEFCYEV
jgi:hypothetical protein